MPTHRTFHSCEVETNCDFPMQFRALPNGKMAALKGQVMLKFCFFVQVIYYDNLNVDIPKVKELSVEVKFGYFFWHFCNAQQIESNWNESNELSANYRKLLIFEQFS